MEADKKHLFVQGLRHNQLPILLRPGRRHPGPGPAGWRHRHPQRERQHRRRGQHRARRRRRHRLPDQQLGRGLSAGGRQLRRPAEPGPSAQRQPARPGRRAGQQEHDRGRPQRRSPGAREHPQHPRRDGRGVGRSAGAGERQRARRCAVRLRQPQRKAALHHCPRDGRLRHRHRPGRRQLPRGPVCRLQAL